VLEDLLNKCNSVIHLNALTQLQTLLSSQVQEARIPNPDPFSGTSDHCRGFLLQCTMVFSQQSSMYSSDEAKIAYVTGLLRGRALEWAEAFLANQSSAVLSFQDFMSQFKLIFETPEKHHDVSCDPDDEEREEGVARPIKANDQFQSFQCSALANNACAASQVGG
uniref:DUF4939 domain-containing protein n=1 Tax=Oryzias latipes TaxID=8090 RepID=A0A3B3HQ03_ORYLA